MIYTTPIQVRFNDTDAFGHLNNSSYAVYAEYNRIKFLHEVAGLQGNLILANLTINFLKQVVFEDEVTLEASVKKLGNTSIIINQDVKANGDTAASISSVVVLFDYQTQSKQNIPNEVREKLEPYLPVHD